MKRSHKSGFGFGVTSGIITPLGLIVGLYAGTHSTLVIIAGLLTIAIADAFSDALGIHVSKESDQGYTVKEIWEATITTFLSKLVSALLFTIPFLMFHVRVGVIVSVLGGGTVLGIFSYLIARDRGDSPWLAVVEHVGIAAIVVVITYYLPILIQNNFV